MAVQVQSLLDEMETLVGEVTSTTKIKLYSTSDLRNPDLKPILPCISIAYMGIEPTSSDKNMVPSIRVAIYYIGMDECEDSAESKLVNQQAVSVLDGLRDRIVGTPTCLNREWEFVLEKPLVIKEPDGRSLSSMIQVWQVLVPQIGR